jgi:RNA polymerase sigma factor (sigma-70 family)
VSDFAASSPPAPTRGLPLRLLSDERLARLAAAGSARAFAVLYERHHQALYRYCRAIVRHEHDAQDALQTTMTRAFAALGRSAPDAPMRPWLFRIAHNEAISVLRRRRPTTALDEAPEPEAPALEARVEDRSRLTALVADLNGLPDRQRGALVMRELSGLSHDDIAAALGISVPAAKQAIFDARTGLREFEKGRAMDCADVQRLVSERDGRMLRGRPVRAHLRSCDSCRALRDAIAMRRADLAALAPPLPAAAATGLLSSILGGGGAGGLTSSVAAKVATGALTGKALAGAAVVATVAVGGAQVLPRAHDSASSPGSSRPGAVAPPRPRAVAPPRPAPAPRAASVSVARGKTTTAATAGADRRAVNATRHRPPGAGTPHPSDRAATPPRQHETVPPSATAHGRSPAAASHSAAGGRPAASHAHARRSHPAKGPRPVRGRPATSPRPARGRHRPDAASRPARGRPSPRASTRAPSHPSRPATPASGARSHPAHAATPAPKARRPAGRPAGATGTPPPPAAAGGGGAPATPAAPVAPAAAQAAPAASPPAVTLPAPAAGRAASAPGG